MRLTRIGVAALAVAMLVAGAAPAQQWTTIKGQVLLPSAPKPTELNVTADKEHCLSKGPLLDDTVIVNPKNKGLKNVWVYLVPDAAGGKLAVHPDLAKPASKEHVIDQPCCQFVPRILAMRDGDTLLVKNSSPKAHNINVSADAPSPSFNQTLPPGGDYKAPAPFVAQKSPVTFACNIHPWMGGRMMVFDHPYFAITDADGKFEIKMAPAKGAKIVYRHENGYHKGAAGRNGWPIEGKVAGNDTELKPHEFEFPKPK
jgi:plastocyanin